MSKFWALNGGNCQYKDFRFCGVLLENDGEQSKDRCVDIAIRQLFSICAAAL